MIGKSLKSFKYAWNGLTITWREENNFKIEVAAGVLVTFSMLYFHFSLPEILFCILAITLVLSAEIINTAIEDLCDKVEPNTDPIIAKIKDTSSAFVLVSSLGACIMGILVFAYHFHIF